MPSTTFFNLPAEKREKLLSAARAEFARVPYAEASINKMIQAADIPGAAFTCTSGTRRSCSSIWRGSTASGSPP